MSSERIELTRDCEVVEVPGGRTVQLTRGTPVSITQALGGSYTLLVHTLGGLYRLAGRDADAIGREAAPAADLSSSPPEGGTPKTAAQLRDQVWAQLKTCFDPEIPVNIVDLGLIYELDVAPDDKGGNRVDIKMTLTAQGCGMGDSIAADARHKIERLTGVSSADVQVVWEPAWTPERISAEGKELLGIV
jgi:probable FeS assembly SUF system protein SufT